MVFFSRVSIITICCNNLADLKSTIKSVNKQIEFPFEHIIVDGSTNEEILNYLTTNHQPAYRKWLCEKDNGIADAFNKGIKMSQGNVLVMLNSGDEFYDSRAIKLVNETFNKNNRITWLHSKYTLRRSSYWVTIGKPFDKGKLYRGMRSLCHQTMFIKKVVYDKYGNYSELEKIGMDYDFVCRMSSEPFEFLEATLVKFKPEGVSSKLYLQSLKDAKRIYFKHFGFSTKLILWQIRLKLLHFLLHSFLGKFLYSLKVKLGLANA